MPTGIFFHYQQGERLRDFPQALATVLARDNVFFYDALYPAKPRSSFDLEPVSMETLYRIHAPEAVDRVRATGDYEGALYSAAGTVAAASRICSGELTNGFVFTGYGDHHAGHNFFGGGCYFNGAALAICTLRERFGIERFAIIDTDAHHGNGTWDLFKSDSQVLYLCFCPERAQETNQNVNIHVPFRVGDKGYLSLARNAIKTWVKGFQPEIIFRNWGYDGTIGDYGDMGLTPELHLALAEEFKQLAQDLCEGKLVVILCGGSRRDLAFTLIPRIIEILAD